MEFPERTQLSERVLWPHAAAERHGMEDARFVRFVDDGGEVEYHATYTAFDGSDTTIQLLSTTDFASFAISPTAGVAARGKGLAIFPRKVGGRYVALSRSDRETNEIASSDDLHCWGEPRTIQAPERPWELLQLGNCGSPIETDEGWLVLTHGVGAMRTYAVGAVLLDLDDPSRVLRRTSTPLLSPGLERRQGYVPNVVYSCGAFVDGDLLVVPYGVGDQWIAVAKVPVRRLLDSMTSAPSALSAPSAPSDVEASASSMPA